MRSKSTLWAAGPEPKQRGGSVRSKASTSPCPSYARSETRPVDSPGSHQSTSAFPASRCDPRPGENEGMYCLHAVIATESVLRELAGSTAEACIVPLGQHLWLLPMTDALF